VAEVKLVTEARTALELEVTNEGGEQRKVKSSMQNELIVET